MPTEADVPTTADQPKRAEAVADRIRARIARHELVAGDPLPPETTLMEEFGVARPTMREALRILESEGLVTVKRGKHGGPRIAVPRVDVVARRAGFLLQVQGTSLADVFRARRAIEAPAMTDLAPLRTTPVLAALQDTLDRAGQLTDDEIVERGTELHNEFHRIITQAGGGDTLTLFHAVIESIIGRSARSFVQQQTDPGTRRQAFLAAVQDHSAVLAAVQRGDGEAAAALWSNHLLGLEERLLRSEAGHPARIVDLFG